MPAGWRRVFSNRSICSTRDKALRTAHLGVVRLFMEGRLTLTGRKALIKEN